MENRDWTDLEYYRARKRECRAAHTEYVAAEKDFPASTHEIHTCCHVPIVIDTNIYVVVSNLINLLHFMEVGNSNIYLHFCWLDDLSSMRNSQRSTQTFLVKDVKRSNDERACAARALREPIHVPTYRFHCHKINVSGSLTCLRPFEGKFSFFYVLH